MTRVLMKQFPDMVNPGMTLSYVNSWNLLLKPNPVIHFIHKILVVYKMSPEYSCANLDVTMIQ